MDDVTHQNASLVEESAAAAASLQDQANTLAALVGTFRVDDQDAVPAVWSCPIRRAVQWRYCRVVDQRVIQGPVPLAAQALC
ncbi:hypothetical protein [Castellaniella sp.]|uniref:hypothetical protein n=1 Tax=Castellaniella sp. TaxID=1955812 RepID=UPI002B002B4F|nr:hypothetical protein [Castellaniella sp.]